MWRVGKVESAADREGDAAWKGGWLVANQKSMIMLLDNPAPR